ncbi:hypothetical protein BKA63DRAFT_603409 [Paraphoma chrysanthemicola]|nr:hypothetical protein BKA63DRAFT_603409 [Paraphoma chrysanthemicola]
MADLELNRKGPSLARSQTCLETLKQSLGIEPQILSYLPTSSVYRANQSNIIEGYSPYVVAIGTVVEANNVQVTVSAYMSTTYRQNGLPELRYYGAHPRGSKKQYRLENVVVEGTLRDEFQPVKELGSTAIACLVQCLFIIKDASIPAGSFLGSSFLRDVRVVCYRYKNIAGDRENGVDHVEVKATTPEVANSRAFGAPTSQLWPTNTLSARSEAQPSYKAPSNLVKDNKRKQALSASPSPAHEAFEDMQVVSLSGVSLSPTSPVTPQARNNRVAPAKLASRAVVLDGFEHWASLKRKLCQADTQIATINEKMRTTVAERDEVFCEVRRSIDEGLQKQHNADIEMAQKKYDFDTSRMRKRHTAELKKLCEEHTEQLDKQSEKHTAELRKLREKHKNEMDLAMKECDKKMTDYLQKEHDIDEELRANLQARFALTIELEAEEEKYSKEQVFAALGAVYTASPVPNKRLKVDHDGHAEKKK